MSGVAVEQVIHSYADFQCLVLEESMSKEQVAEHHLVIVALLHALGLYVLGSSGKCESLEEYPLQPAGDPMGEVVVLYKPEFAAVLIAVVSCAVADGEVKVLADIAVQPSAELIPVCPDGNEVFIYHARELAERHKPVDVEVAPDESQRYSE